MNTAPKSPLPGSTTAPACPRRTKHAVDSRYRSTSSRAAYSASSTCRASLSEPSAQIKDTDFDGDKVRSKPMASRPCAVISKPSGCTPAKARVSCSRSATPLSPSAAARLPTHRPAARPQGREVLLSAFDDLSFVVVEVAALGDRQQRCALVHLWCIGVEVADLSEGRISWGSRRDASRRCVWSGERSCGWLSARSRCRRSTAVGVHEADEGSARDAPRPTRPAPHVGDARA